MAVTLLLAGTSLAALLAALLFFVARARRSEQERESLRGELEEARLALVRSETHLRQAGRLARVAPYEISLDTFEGRWADGIFDVLGLDPRSGAVLGVEYLDRFVYPEDQAKLRAKVATVDRSNRSFEVDFRVVRTDGAVRHVEIAAELVRPLAGRPAILLGTLLDVTDRYQAEKLREHGAAVLRSAADAIVSVDLSGVITTWNRGAEAILGYSAEEIVGRHGDELWVDAELARELLELARSGEDVVSHEIGAKRRDGATILLSITVSPLRDANGRIVGVSSVAQDITERKRLDAELRQRQKLEALGTLAGGIAHDFNNLLWVILGSAQLAQRAAGLPSPAAGQLERIVGAARRATELVDRILSFARPSAVAPRPIHLGKVVEESVGLLRSAAPPDVRIVTDLRVAGPWVAAEPAQLSQVVMNLGTNALAAVAGAGTITFRLNDGEEDLGGEGGVRLPCVLLEVSDTGAGIEPEHLDRIFDPFFTTREVGRGSGLGLAIVQGIVTSLGGEIDLHTSVGRGSSFRIRLPRTTPPLPPADAGGAAERRRSAGRGEEILVVDDDPQVLALLESLLLEAGYAVRAFSDPAAALARFEAEPDRFRLVVTDEIMPKLNGSDLLGRMRVRRPELRGLLLTGYHDPLGDAPPLDGVMRKPIESSELIDRIQRLLSDLPGPRQGAR